MDANNSGYLIKSVQTPWQDHSMITVDAGTLAAGIHDILRNQLLLDNVQSSVEAARISSLGEDAEHIHAQGGISEYYRNFFATNTPHIQIQHPAKGTTIKNRIFPNEALPCASPWSNTWHIVNNLLSSVLITHPHMDHIAGLVINSSNFNFFKPKHVGGLHYTLDSLRAHVFNGVVWPNMTNEGSDAIGFLKLKRMSRAKPHFDQPNQEWVEQYTYNDLALNLKVLPFAVSHGTASLFEARRSSSVVSASSHARKSPAHQQQQQQQPMAPPPSKSEEHGTYLSTAYFITDDLTDKSILIWGDVEPDIISARPRNLPVWTHAARLYTAGALQAVFIECSYANPHEDSMLFGHFTPTHLFRELAAFRAMCEPPTLAGLSFIITHVKNQDPLLLIPQALAAERRLGENVDHPATAEKLPESPYSPADKIKHELDRLKKEHGLECTFSIAVAGHSYVF